MERAEKILAKELARRDEIDVAVVRVDELRSVQELVHDALAWGAATALKRAERVLREMRDEHAERGEPKLALQADYYATVSVPELRTLHGAVVDARGAAA